MLLGAVVVVVGAVGPRLGSTLESFCCSGKWRRRITSSEVILQIFQEREKRGPGYWVKYPAILAGTEGKPDTVSRKSLK